MRVHTNRESVDVDIQAEEKEIDGKIALKIIYNKKNYLLLDFNQFDYICFCNFVHELSIHSDMELGMGNTTPIINEQSLCSYAYSQKINWIDIQAEIEQHETHLKTLKKYSSL